MQMTVRVSVAGASGYAGVELVRLLLQHPEVELVHLVAGEQRGRPAAEVFPALRGLVEQTLIAADWRQIAADSDVALLALPHGVSVDAVPQLLAGDCKVVDLGADFRLRDPATYRRWYGEEHRAPELLDEAVYGLPELYRDQIREARLVANPGCYPTASCLALWPLLSRIDAETTVVVDAKSGVSGAGRKGGVALSYCEVDESLRPYGVLEHRHAPEIEQTMAANGCRAPVAFVPHLVPMRRGILATCYVWLDTAQPTAADRGEELTGLFREAYAHEPFVRTVHEPPATKNTLGSNFCDLAVRCDPRGGPVVVMSAIDNLGKGAAGQAVQNLNLICGLAEATGLGGAPLFP